MGSRASGASRQLPQALIALGPLALPFLTLAWPLEQLAGECQAPSLEETTVNEGDRIS